MTPPSPPRRAPCGGFRSWGPGGPGRRGPRSMAPTRAACSAIIPEKELDMARASDFNAVLGVERSADEREIKKAYFRLVRQYSPESHPEEFKRIREAYEVLGHLESRAEYDSLTRYG